MSSDSIDSLAFNIALIGLSLLMGGGLKLLLVRVDGLLPDRLGDIGLLKGMPLFPLYMFGGIIVQRLFQAAGAGAMISRGQIQRLAEARSRTMLIEKQPHMSGSIQAR